MNYAASVRLKNDHLVQEISIVIDFGIIFQLELSQKDQISKTKEKAIKNIEALLTITKLM